MQAQDGTVFAAPTLIIHYIAAHGYLPPEQFIAALEEWTEPESVTFEAAAA
jgi:hypothetical protein